MDSGTMKLWFLAFCCLVCVLDSLMVAKAIDQGRKLLVIVGFIIITMQCLIIGFSMFCWAF